MKLYREHFTDVERILDIDSIDHDDQPSNHPWWHDRGSGRHYYKHGRVHMLDYDECPLRYGHGGAIHDKTDGSRICHRCGAIRPGVEHLEWWF